ncbi:MAG: DNA polymerase ligase N-terminal domain-containing protein [Candidatus Aenigmatarchaeota archaeon]
MKDLTDYEDKRDLEESGEPKDSDSEEVEKIREEGKRVYSVQKHDASRLHYDLRLEKGGVLKSWAIPKGPSQEEGVKRLAVQTEDHPLSYAFFEGTIEEGHYGAGEVEVWDRGTFKIEKWKENEIIVDIDGEKLTGKYVLIRFKPDEEPDNWLFFKKKQ